MVKRSFAFLIISVIAAVSLAGVGGSAAADPVAPNAAAVITFDLSSGRVVDEHNARTPLRVASTIKLLTALVVRANVPMDEQVLITERAEQVPPLKLTMTPGTHWRANDLLHAMLIASLNDAATALAIRAGGGTLAGFHTAVSAESRRLGLADDPKLHDPAGLDDAESVDGGNLISARDLAIVTRTFLADPLLAGIVRLPSYRFDGGDGRPHVVYNHNAFLNVYPGAIGVKTGYTEKSGHSLVAAATRNGRTFVTVVVSSTNPVGVATAQLDAAFAGQGSGTIDDRLPAPGIAPAVLGSSSNAARRARTFTAVVAPKRQADMAWMPIGAALVVVIVGGSIVGRARRSDNRA